MTIETEDVVINLQEDNRITLNCTYRSNSTDVISERNIRWQKQINGTFIDVAIFSPPYGSPPYITENMQDVYINRTELIRPNNSFSAVMIIKDLLCTDEGAYKCSIKYFVGISSEKEKAVSSVVVFNSKYIPPTKCSIFRIYQTHSMIRSMKVYQK